jgi:hypothetical protein
MPADTKQFPLRNEGGVIAYVLKGYPRLTDTFITSEVYRMEQQGLRLRVFVIKPCTEPVPSDLLDKIAAKPVYMPATTSMSKSSLFKWLSANLLHFMFRFGALSGSIRWEFCAQREQLLRKRRARAKDFGRGRGKCMPRNSYRA